MVSRFEESGGLRVPIHTHMQHMGDRLTKITQTGNVSGGDGAQKVTSEVPVTAGVVEGNTRIKKVTTVVITVREYSSCHSCRGFKLC